MSTMYSFALNKVAVAINKAGLEPDPDYNAVDFSVMMGIIFDKDIDVILVDIVNKGIELRNK